jgi:hypothetical protein
MNDQTTANQLDIITKALKELTEQKAAEQVSVDAVMSNLRCLEFRATDGSNYGKGLIFSGKGYTKQLIFSAKPDRFFSSEHLDLAKDRHVSINNLPVLTENELGNSVVKSNLKEVGRLKGLIVDGPIIIDENLFYNTALGRLGLGTDSPNASIAVAEDGIEVLLGTDTRSQGIVGTFASHDFNIVTDYISRISVSANGNIVLGNEKTSPVRVKVLGKMSINVNNPDPDVDLHVNGTVRFNNRLQIVGNTIPVSGNFGVGDIVWNESPAPGRFVGWICVRAGSPGEWHPFGEIRERG